MLQYCAVEFKPGSREELLPDFDEEFPHIITRAAFLEGDSAPWHWHKAVELFYVESGMLEYVTPSGSFVFPAGSGGMVNSNVLHMTRGHRQQSENCHVLHLFDPVLVAGTPGSRMDRKYVLPLTTASQVEVISLDAQVPEQGKILDLLRRSFCHAPEEEGYEFAVRRDLSEIWMALLQQVQPQLEETARNPAASDQLKQMLACIHEGYGEKLTVKDIARSANISERSCYDLFKKHLRTTPVEYLNSYRLRTACALLAQTEESVTAISGECGMNNSYFCQMFREATGFTPLEYRRFYQRHQSSMPAGQIGR